ncbi:MAG TPA: hypothetical protein VKU77_08810 [Streptosporangiaceae bacterium]|nr:hypothetical protein [Streptosporangiaceae bacterium]
MVATEAGVSLPGGRRAAGAGTGEAYWFFYSLMVIRAAQRLRGQPR